MERFKVMKASGSKHSLNKYYGATADDVENTAGLLEMTSVLGNSQIDENASVLKMSTNTSGKRSKTQGATPLILSPADIENEGDVKDETYTSEKNRNSGYETNLYLYSEEMDDRPRVPTFLNSIADYSNTIPNLADADTKSTTAKQGSSRMGTLVGVYLPCVQNIFGVILFIRLSWVVGTAGVIYGFGIVFTCCCVTMLTAISMSAIATNGVVPAGGPYFLISRSLGPECGGAVGMLFYTGITLAASMYIIGAVEIILTYMAPSLSIFGDFTKDSGVMYNNFRVYGTILLMVMSSIVYVGVKFVNKFASVALACVLLSILSVYVGIFYNFHGSDKLLSCSLGNRLLKDVDLRHCNKAVGGYLYNIYCANGTGPCDSYFEMHNTTVIKGIRGISSGVFFENIFGNFLEAGQFIARGHKVEDIQPLGKNTYNMVMVDITTSFTILIGIFFPSVTGIMAGSNRSGDLADAQKSIPIGTILAILSTSSVYLSAVLLFGATVDNLLLRDKFGQSIGGRLVVANIAWPNEWVILVGATLSTLGAGLQSLTGAPRLLQAIAKDDIIPFLQPFAKSSASGEPTRALIITVVVCQCGILIGNIDNLAPLLAMFLLMCYAFVNLACVLQTLLRTPNWRPRFKYYHWTLSFTGLVLCIAVMFMSSWYFALIALGMAGVIYKYIEYRGAEKEWGDGMRGLALSAARYSLLRLEDAPPHTKNWRPQILMLVNFNADLPKYRKIFSLVSQLKAGKGLTVSATVIEGDYIKKTGVDVQSTKKELVRLMDEEKVKGFADVLVAKNTSEGLSHLIQIAGLGGLKPNTVILGWPNSWQQSENDRSWQVFLHTIRIVTAAKMALIVPKGIRSFPDSATKLSGTIDIWWIVHDGGILMLIPFLLKQHRTWKNCKLRIFTVAQTDDNSIQMKKDLKTFLYQLRIPAEVEVVEMTNNDISAYTYERTLMMEQRNQMLRELRLNKKESFGMVQSIIDQHHRKDASEGRSATKVRFQEETNADDEAKKSKPVDSAFDADDKRSGNGDKPGVLKDSLPRETKDSSTSTLKPDEDNVRRMHTAVKLNEVIVSRSRDAQLVIFNLPGPPKDTKLERESNYMEFLEVMTEGLDKVLMVRGGGREVITIYS
ncbi:solute carrier family 12 member 4 isoform X3 [Sipha flava]|uniref:Solute carrier family 12 member 4 isoform X3 n=1 Tax=Sipha flava TaxID=143950 RepID=A0A8B8F2S1_9HEMI|nr:solute carrier family 12 member 4 isoform X3 [Sipha flava]